MNHRIWRSMLYVPGNNPSMLQKCGFYGADAVILDLEDSVSEEEKKQARYLVDEALGSGVVSKSDVVVRINSFHSPFWKSDLEMVLSHQIAAVKIPKVQNTHEMKEICNLVLELERINNTPLGTTKIIPTIENAMGVMRLPEICEVGSERISYISFGSEDFMTQTNISRSKLVIVKTHIVTVAKAFGKDVIDSVFPDFHDLEALRRECFEAKSIGISGKSAIHPDQIWVINEVFSPSSDEIKHAKKILELSKQNKDGAFQYNGQMIDKPIVERCRRILQLSGDKVE